mgnify:FL=1|jgi:uncharacterized protein YbbC (DUF1343 family)|tara:strand:- start:28641 stop:29861 length:1221 start_codon:yes stop_codon:yes gene_type:complete
MRFGIDRLLSNSELQRELSGKRLAVVGNPASMTEAMLHSLDALIACDDLDLASSFGPQHGMRGEKQDNMIESQDYVDPVHKIPVFSLYGEYRRPTDQMLDSFDHLLFDLQDLGCRIYTYISTLKYMLEACASTGKSIWVLDRPNPAGRPIDGMRLVPGEESFVGCDELPMRYGLTSGELAGWFVHKNALPVDLKVIEMEDYDPEAAPGFGWPSHGRAWISPSPNASSLNMARCFPGTVMIEGTSLSEGRGTTMPLECIGAPDIDISKILAAMAQLSRDWMQGADIRPCHFQPTFHKHAGNVCQAVQIHTDGQHYQHHTFRPYRLVALFLKALRQVHPRYPLWRAPPYEYEETRAPIDVINGSGDLRLWVDDDSATIADLDVRLTREEQEWQEERAPFLLYQPASRE